MKINPYTTNTQVMSYLYIMKSLKQYRLEKGITTRHQLSDEEIKKIITLRSEGVSYDKIARLFDRSQSTIIKIVKKIGQIDNRSV